MSLPPGKPLHWQGEQSGQRRGLQRLRGECSDWFVTGRTEGDLHRRPVTPLPLASQPEIHVCWGEQRLNWWFTGQTCGEDWGGWHRDSLKELEHGAVTTGSVRGRSQAHDKSKAPLLSGAQSRGSGEAALAPLSPHHSRCLCGLQKSMPQPPPWGFLPQRPPTLQSLPQWALGADTSRLPRHRDGNEITAKPQVT